MKMSIKIILLICLISFSKKMFPYQVNSSIIIRIIRTDYEQIRESIHRLNKVSRVRSASELRAKGNELATLDFIGLVQQHEGYTAEEYDVKTEDGYILKLHRISNSPLSPEASNKSVVFMQHGIAASSDIFVNFGPTRDLAFLIADAGYDVWLGNVRGNFYSRRHLKYSSASTNYDFWKFNLDDMSLKDIPALIDSVLQRTYKTKLIYIGHSMGTTMNFMLLSSKPEYNNKIDLSITLAPVALFMKPFSLFLKSLLACRVLIPLGHVLRIYELLPLSKFIILLAKNVCTNIIGFYLCSAILSAFLNSQNLYYSDISSIFSVIFNGASLDTLTHFGQIASKEKFRKFDYGFLLNQEKYNSSEPPEYDLSKVTSPQAIFYTVRDTFIRQKATEKVKKQLKNVIFFEKVPDHYKHYDLIWAKDAKTVYFYKILDLIKKFS